MADHTPLPELPCPHCGANILLVGFHNNCTEWATLCEHHHPFTSTERLRLRRYQDGYKVIRHECGIQTYCCRLLPWLRSRILELDDMLLAGVESASAALIEEARGDLPDA